MYSNKFSSRRHVVIYRDEVGDREREIEMETERRKMEYDENAVGVVGGMKMVRDGDRVTHQ